MNLTDPLEDFGTGLDSQGTAKLRQFLAAEAELPDADPGGFTSGWLGAIDKVRRWLDQELG